MSHCAKRVTQRDIRILADLFGHSVLTAEHLLGLGHFSSIVRCRARLRLLARAGLACTADSLPVQAMRKLYRAAPRAARLIASHTGLEESEIRSLLSKPCTPFLLEHSLKVTELRIWLQSRCQLEWLCESECRHAYCVLKGAAWEKHVLKPDGFFRILGQDGSRCFFVEMDLGHVSRPKFKAKVASYRRYAQGVFQETYGEARFSVLVVTTGSLRLRHLLALVGKDDPRFLFTTLEGLQQSIESVWSDASSTNLISLIEVGL